MNFDDVIYLTLLFSSIAFGTYYRRIENVQQKKLIGTCVGLIITVIVSGVHILHSFLTFSINALIILFIDKRKCHLVSFTFSFLYLFFFRTTIHFGIPYPPAHTNLIQMMLTLKMVGLAFEINANDDASFSTPSLQDMFHYAFNYIGVLTGPYYRYKTFNDYFQYNFHQHANWQQATIDKIKYIPLFAAIFLVGGHYWPISYALSDEFYQQRSWLYRYWYIWPSFLVFRMRIYIGLVLSECVCTMAGLGAYPSITKPKSGQGPSENFEKLQDKQLKEIDYDFNTIKNVNPYGCEFGTTYRDGMKEWNICIQYWLGIYVYKRFPSKKYRTIVTMLVSAYWHGVYLGYYVCIGTVPLPLALEAMYYKLFLKDKKEGTSSKIYEWIHWFFRMHFFSYQAIAFLLLNVPNIMHYYNSIYHAGLVLGIVLYVIGLQMLKARPREEKQRIE